MSIHPLSGIGSAAEMCDCGLGFWDGGLGLGGCGLNLDICGLVNITDASRHKEAKTLNLPILQPNHNKVNASGNE